MNNINYQPLIDIKDDKLGFNESSSTISNFIESFPNNQPYSIAIFGSWGSGKSTMLNFIEQKLDPKKNIIIRFNPWLILNEENLVSSIFEEIAYVIQGKKNVKLKKKLINYGRKICVSGSKLISKNILKHKGVEDEIADSISDFSSNCVDSLFNSDSPVPLSKKKIELEEELTKWSKIENKKIVIFIDEIDRLFPLELVEIFKLVKATISFPSVMFVVAMDKQSVTDSLEIIGIKRADEYLTKIFQQRIHINTNFQLKTLFKELLLPLIETLPTLSKEALTNSIEALIFFNKNKYYIPDFEPNPMDNRVNSENEYKSNIINKYNAVYWQLSEYLSIPRNFTNYMSFIISKWDYFYNQLSLKGNLSQRDSIACFVILSLFFINPDLVENRSLGNRMNYNKVDYPLLFTTIRYDFLNVIYPKSVEQNLNNRNVYDDEIIIKAIYLLKKYPDFRKQFEII